MHLSLSKKARIALTELIRKALSIMALHQLAVKSLGDA